MCLQDGTLWADAAFLYLLCCWKRSEETLQCKIFISERIAQNTLNKMQFVQFRQTIDFFRHNFIFIYNFIFVFCLSAYLIGKIFMYMFVANLGGDIAFAVVYIYSAELFPTTVR